MMGKAGDEAILALAHAYRAFVNEHPGLTDATVQAADRTDAPLVALQSEVVDIALRAVLVPHVER